MPWVHFTPGKDPVPILQGVGLVPGQPGWAENLVPTEINRNEYQEYFLGGKGGRCVGLTTLPPSCANCLEIWEPQPPGTLWACQGL